jgi:hypothetical protein
VGSLIPTRTLFLASSFMGQAPAFKKL